MDVLARLALPGILALSVISALIVAALLVRYGFVAPEEDDYDAERRITSTRLGHMFLFLFLAGIAVLAAAALRSGPPSGVGASPSSTPGKPPAKAASMDTPDPGQPARRVKTQPEPPGRDHADEAVAVSPPADTPEPARSGRAAAAAARPEAPGPTRMRQAVAPAQRPQTPEPAPPADRPAARAEMPEPARGGDEAPAPPPKTAMASGAETSARGSRTPAPLHEDRSEDPDVADDVNPPPRPEVRAVATPLELPPRPASTWGSPARPPAMPIVGDAAPSVPAGRPQLSASIQGVRVDVHREAAGADDVIYTIHLADPANQPLTGADVSLLGRGADGRPVRAELSPAGEPGYYQARLGAQPPGGLRLRVVHASARFEVSLDHPVNW